MTIVIEDPYGLAKPPPAGKVTYEQFLEWLDENTSGEWVDGEAVPMSVASAQHQDISGFLAALLRLYAEEHTSGMALAAPFQMRLSRIRRGRAPDLMFIMKEHVTQLKPSLRKRADSFVLDSEERYQRVKPDGEGRYESAALPGFWINVGWLWCPFLPPIWQGDAGVGGGPRRLTT